MHVLIACDSAEIRRQVREAIPDPAASVREVTRGAEVLPAIEAQTPDLAVLDLQIGKMGGIAVCQDIHLEQGAGRLPRVPVLIMVDRRADVFLARRSLAEGWVVKPLDALRLNRAMRAILDGGRYEDDSYRPITIPIPGAEVGSAG